MRLEDKVFPETVVILPYTIFDIDGTPLDVFLRVINAATAQKVTDSMDQKGGLNAVRAKGTDFRVIAAVVCKEDGSDLYTEEQAKALPQPIKYQLTDIALKLIIPQTEGTPKN